MHKYILISLLIVGCAPRVNVQSTPFEPVEETKPIEPVIVLATQQASRVRETAERPVIDVQMLIQQSRELYDTMQKALIAAKQRDEQYMTVLRLLEDLRVKYKKLADDWVRVDQERKTAWVEFQKEQERSTQKFEQGRQSREDEIKNHAKATRDQTFGWALKVGVGIMILAGMVGAMISTSRGLAAAAFVSGALGAAVGVAGLMYPEITAMFGLIAIGGSVALGVVFLFIWYIKEMRATEEEAKKYKSISHAVIAAVNDVRDAGTVEWEKARGLFHKAVVRQKGITQKDMDEVIHEVEADEK